MHCMGWVRCIIDQKVHMGIEKGLDTLASTISHRTPGQDDMAAMSSFA